MMKAEKKTEDKKIKSIQYEAPKNSVSKVVMRKSGSCAPCGRYGHKVVMYEGKMIMYGGFDGTKRLDETYSYDVENKTWKRVATKGVSPGKRDCHSAVLYRDRMVVFGGGNGKFWLNDLVEYDITRSEWRKLDQHGDVPTPRAGHSAAVYKDEMYVFGGWDGNATNNDLFCYNFLTHTWKRLDEEAGVHGDVPKKRDSHQAVVWNDSMIIVGGGDGSTRVDDMYGYNITQKRWQRIEFAGDGMLGRAGHVCLSYSDEVNVDRSITSAPQDNKLVMFGGGNGSDWIKHVFEFDLNSHRWIEFTINNTDEEIPSSYGAAGVVYKNRLVLFGGGNGEDWFSDVYEFKLNMDHKSQTQCRLKNILHRDRLTDCSIKFKEDSSSLMDLSD